MDLHMFLNVCSMFLRVFINVFSPVALPRQVPIARLAPTTMRATTLRAGKTTLNFAGT